MQGFLNSYKRKLIDIVEKIDNSIIEDIKNALEKTIERNSIVYVLGNGGSSATASHMVNDLGIGLSRRNIKNFNIVSLADNTPVLTAIANDIGYDEIFLAQLKNKLTKNDLVIAISCSGDSDNIVKAVRYAQSIGSTIVGLTGFDGGELKRLSDISFHVDTPKGEYGLVEDIHMILDHMIYSYYISKSLAHE
jgi:D-sedoheptulose 7-phosphate isomerase